MKKIVVLLTLVLTLGACGTQSDPAPTETVTVTEGAVETRRELEDSHDWASVEAYHADMADSTEKISAGVEIWSYATSDWIEGFYNDNEFLDLNATFHQALMTHLDHFEGRTPPAEYASVHDKVIRSWELLAQAAEYIEQGVVNYDLEYLERANQALQESNRLVNEATREMGGALETYV